MQIPQKKKKKEEEEEKDSAPKGSSNSTSVHLNEENKNNTSKDTCIPKFTAALLKTVKIQKQ